MHFYRDGINIDSQRWLWRLSESVLGPAPSTRQALSKCEWAMVDLMAALGTQRREGLPFCSGIAEFRKGKRKPGEMLWIELVLWKEHPLPVTGWCHNLFESPFLHLESVDKSTVNLHYLWIPYLQSHHLTKIYSKASNQSSWHFRDHLWTCAEPQKNWVTGYVFPSEVGQDCLVPALTLRHVSFLQPHFYAFCCCCWCFKWPPNLVLNCRLVFLIPRLWCALWRKYVC